MRYFGALHKKSPQSRAWMEAKCLTQVKPRHNKKATLHRWQRSTEIDLLVGSQGG